MAAPNPIQGISLMNVGSTTTFTDTTLGGVWSSTDAGVVSIGGSTGIATAVTAGSCQIVYTVSGSATAINVTSQAVNSITNGINYNIAYNSLSSRIQWRSSGLVSNSGRYYEDFHTLNDTAILDAIRPEDGRTLAQYLANKQSAVVLEVLNAVYNAPQVIDKPKLAFWRNQGNQLPLQYVANQNQFVGLRIYVGKGDTAVKLNSLQLFFSTAASFNLYLYNDMNIAPFLTIPVSCNALEQTIIDLGETVILNNLVPTAYKEGTWYLGYYQADLPNGCQAIYYPVGYNRFSPLTVLAFSAPLWNDAPDGQRNFLRNNIGANNLMYGMNLEISTYVDATNTIVQGAGSGLWDEAIGLCMSVRDIQDIIFNYQTGALQRAVNSVPELSKLYSDLNGYKADEQSPYVMGLKDKMNRAIKTVKAGFQNYSSLSIGTA